MTVLHLHESTEIHGGAEVYIHELQPMLLQEGISTFWIGISVHDGLFRVSEYGKPDIQMLARNGVKEFLDRFIDGNGIDIINIHSLFDAEIVSFCLFKKPVIKFSHSPIMVCPGRDKYWRKAEQVCTVPYGLHCFRHIYTQGCANRNPADVIASYRYVHFELSQASRQYKKIVVMSEYMKGGLRECGVPVEKIDLNPYFTAVVEDIHVSDQTEKRLLFMGRLISSKGPHIMIRSLAAMLKSDASVFLDIVGDGIMMNELKKMVEKEGLQHKIIFHGWQDRTSTREMISGCFAVIFPSIYPEAFGIVGIEAMMHGKPVIAFNVGGVSTWLEHGETGFFAERENPHSIANYVKVLIRDTERYRSMGTRAHEVAKRRFGPQRHLKHLIHLYSSCLKLQHN